MLGEHELIARIRRRAGSPPAWVTLGIGDDAAVIEPERSARIVLTTDSLVEQIHFTRQLTSWRAIGHKALAVNLSDLAAMGAAPRASLLSLALPTDVALADFDELVEGFVTLAGQAGAPLVGGNLTRSPGPVVIDVTAVGSARPRRLLTRSGGRPGDELFVTGQLGAAAAGLALLRAGAARAALDADASACVCRFERPDARVRCGVTVARRRAASAAIDVSDGLADAVHQLAIASKTGAVVDASDVPVHPGAAGWAANAKQDPLALALSGGEDYELLFAVSRRHRRNFFSAIRQSGDLTATRVGRLQAEPGAWLNRDGRLEPLGPGFVHF
jgi:thiamine-monophosphate kinase